MSEAEVTFAPLNTSMYNLSTVAMPTMVPWKRDLQAFFRIFLPCVLVIIMLSMGCDITISGLKYHLKRPWGASIGLMCQFLLLPAASVAMSFACQLKNHMALGLLVVACSPGGTLSNMFAYWVDGDVPLSLSMTTISTFMAIGMMPFNLFIYARIWTDKGTTIPFQKIAICLVSILVPVGLGMLIRWKSQRAAQIVLKIGSGVALLCVAAVTIILSILYPHMYTSGWQPWVAGTVLPLTGLCMGFAIARMCGLSYSRCRTVAYETGSQNTALALSLLALSFDGVEFLKMSIMALIYTVSLLVEGFALVAVYKIYALKGNKKENDALELPEKNPPTPPNEIKNADIEEIKQ